MSSTFFDLASGLIKCSFCEEALQGQSADKHFCWHWSDNDCPCKKCSRLRTEYKVSLKDYLDE